MGSRTQYFASVDVLPSCFRTPCCPEADAYYIPQVGFGNPRKEKPQIKETVLKPLTVLCHEPLPIGLGLREWWDFKNSQVLVIILEEKAGQVNNQVWGTSESKAELGPVVQVSCS